MIIFRRLFIKDEITDVVICGGDGTVNAVVGALQGDTGKYRYHTHGFR